MKNKRYAFSTMVVTLLLSFSIILFQAIKWANLYFSDLTFGQILFHLKVPLAGTDETIIESFIDMVIFPAIIISIIFLGIHLIFLKRKTKWHLNFVLFPKRKEKKKVKLNIFPGIASLIPVTVVSVVLLGLALNNAQTYFDFFGYLSAQITQSNFIEEQYVEPKGVLTFPQEKKNLIYIYMESIEATFGAKEDGGAFTENLMPELTNLAKDHISFSDQEHLLGGHPSTVGTGWTMAAMFSHSTGLPLKVPVQGNSLSEFSTFFPGATSIGEILEDEGYENYLMIGSDATFGGRRNFYTQHGNYDIYDYHRALEDGVIPEGYRVWWGLEDQKLYSWAKEELLRISKNKKPFNFTMLTVDTHHEDGYVCELCEDEFEEQYANVIACASRQIDDFITWIKSQDFYDNTSIVIVGDHPTMDSDFTRDIDEDYIRTTYNTFINSGIDLPQNRLRNRDFYSFDLLPTTLASLGVDIQGDRVALGTNLFSQRETLFEEFGEEMYEQLLQKSRFYDKKFLYGE